MKSLQIENNDVMPAWLNLLSEDVAQKRYEETIELCTYYPESKDKTILLSSCHFNQKNFNYLQSADLSTEELESMFRKTGTDRELVLENMIALLEKYIDGQEWELEDIIEAYLNFLSPNVSDVFNCIEVYLNRALLVKAVAIAEKILKIDPSIEHHLTYLKSLVRSRKYFEDTYELTNQISIGADKLLKITQKQDFETKLKVAKILMLDSATFQEGKDLFSQCYNTLGSKDNFVSSYLIPLVKTKDYLDKVLALALDFFPESLPIILSQLYYRYKNTKNKSYFHLAITCFEHTDLYKEISRKAYLGFVTSAIELDHTAQIAEHLIVLFRIGCSYKDIENIFCAIKNRPLNVIADASKILDDIRLSGGFNSEEINKLRYIIYLAAKERETVLADYQIEEIFNSFISFEDFNRFQPVANFSLQDKLLLSAKYWKILKSFWWFEETKIENLIEKCSILDKIKIINTFLNAFNEIDSQSAEAIVEIVLRFYLNLDNKTFTEISEKINSINNHKSSKSLQTSLANQRFDTLKESSIEGCRYLEQIAILRLLRYLRDIFSDNYIERRVRLFTFSEKNAYSTSILTAQSWLVNVLLEHSIPLNISQTVKKRLKQFIFRIIQLEKQEEGFDLSYKELYKIIEIESTTEEYYQEISLSIERRRQHFLTSLNDETKRKILLEYFNWLLLERDNIVKIYDQFQIIDLLNEKGNVIDLSGLILIFREQRILDFSTININSRINHKSHFDTFEVDEMCKSNNNYDNLNNNKKIEIKHPIKKVTKNTERHLKVNFSNEVIKEKKAELTIQLTISVPIQSLVSKITELVFPKGKNHVLVDIKVTAPGFAIRKDITTIKVPKSADSEIAVFALYGEEIGAQNIEIEIFYKGARIAYAIATTTVNEKSTGLYSELSSTPPTLVHPPVPPKLTIEATSKVIHFQEVKLDDKISVKKTIHVNWDSKSGNLEFTLYSHMQSEQGTWVIQDSLLETNATDFLKELNAYISEIVVQGSPSEDAWNSTLFTLQSKGQYFYDNFLPEKLRDKTKAWANNSTIILSTNEQWIPWEIFYDGDDFWGKKHIISRYPRIGDRSHIMDSSRTNENSAKKVSRILNVVGGKLPVETSDQAKLLFKNYPTTLDIVTFENKPIYVFPGEVMEKDLIHFTCHGLLDPQILQISNSNSQSDNLSLESVRRLQIHPGCFVFVNACSSSVAAFTFGRFNNFAWEFYRKVADVYIGTLGKVPTKYALDFAEMVYKHLFKKPKGISVGEALQLAKQEATDKKNIFWLLYTLYGEPETLLEIQ